MTGLDELQKDLEQLAITAFIISEDVDFAEETEDEYDRVAQKKWVSFEDATALLTKLVQERDDNKLLVIQAVTKLRTKEQELEGKVLIDRVETCKLLQDVELGLMVDLDQIAIKLRKVLSEGTK